MIIHKGDLMIPDGKGGIMDAWTILPGLSVIIGGMWVANIAYWGFNQYIIQRGLAAKSIAEAQYGMVFAGFLKLLIPLIMGRILGYGTITIIGTGGTRESLRSISKPMEFRRVFQEKQG